MMLKTYKIDAADQALGRVASEAARLLRGKGEIDFKTHQPPNLRVEIINAGKLKLTEQKRRDTKYARYSGYPGGLRFASLGEMIEKKTTAEPLRLAILGMLPRNKWRAKLITRLKISQ